MSRAMRYHYGNEKQGRKGHLAMVKEKRLVYRFGEIAINWRSEEVMPVSLCQRHDICGSSMCLWRKEWIQIRFILIIELQRLAKSDNILVLTSSHVKVLINNIHMVSTLGSRIAWLVWKFKILHLQWCRSLISSALSWDHLVSFWHSGHNSAWCATNILSLCISFTNYNIVWPSTLPKLCSNWLQCLQKNEISV